MDIAWNDVRQRMRGCWWGQMCGDALGSQVEFQTAESLKRQFPDGVRDMGPSPIWGTAPGQVTDDTEMAIELLQVLTECRMAVDWDRVAEGYVRWARSGPFDIGGTVRQATHGAMVALAAGEGVAERMRACANPESKANGALMRESPLAIWGVGQDPETLASYAREDARLTHPNSVCLEASAVYVATLAQVIQQGLDGRAAHTFAVEFQRHFGHEMDVLESLVRAQSDPPPISHHRGYVLLALHNAFYQLLHAQSFEEAVVASVMIGGDTDTNAAIAGALAGARYGMASVPQRWMVTLMACGKECGVDRPRRYLPSEAENQLERLIECRERTISG